jgi:DNA repair protein RecO (recombination protein O)
VARTDDKLGAWLLHGRPFRETSLVIELLTREHGRCTAIARGVKSPRSQRRALLQPFVPLQVSLSGRNELQNLGNVEALGCTAALTGDRLFAALYVNELLVRLLPVHEPAQDVFDEYSRLLVALGGPAPLEPLLRNFELELLDSLGYGLQFTHDADSGAAIRPEASYGLSLESGFVLQEQVQPVQDPSGQQLSFSGSILLAISGRDFSSAETRKVAKKLLRHVLQQHLGTRELASRALFRHGE